MNRTGWTLVLASALTLMTSGQSASGQANPPRRVHEVYPALPESLRTEGQGKNVSLRIRVGPEGRVMDAAVVHGIHPFLDYAALDAIRQWTFESRSAPPDGRSYISEDGGATFARASDDVFLDVQFRFGEDAFPSPRAGAHPGWRTNPVRASNLIRLLDEAAAYARRLKDSCLKFVCREQVDDQVFTYHDDVSLQRSPIKITFVGIQRPGGFGSGFKPFIDQSRTRRCRVTDDYLIVDDQGTLRERRFAAKDGRTLGPREFAGLPGEPPLAVPDWLFGDKNRNRLVFSVAGSNQMDRGDLTIQIKPIRANDLEIQSAKVRVRTVPFRVESVEISGLPVTGCEALLQEAIRYNLKPRLVRTYQYRVEHDGLLFPDRSSVRADYPYPGTDSYFLTKIRTEIKYDSLRFTQIEWETIFKSGVPVLPRLPDMCPSPRPLIR